jgi:hypothetical protein
MAIIADWRASGLPRATYARQHGLSEPTLRMWTRRLKDELNDSLLSAAPPRIDPRSSSSPFRRWSRPRPRPSR